MFTTSEVEYQGPTHVNHPLHSVPPKLHLHLPNYRTRHIVLNHRELILFRDHQRRNTANSTPWTYIECFDGKITIPLAERIKLRHEIRLVVMPLNEIPAVRVMFIGPSSSGRR